MIDIRFQSLNYLQFNRKAIRSAMGKAARVVAKQVRALARNSPGSGRQYMVDGRVHTASRPGEPPARLTGTLAKSIKGRSSKRGYALVVQALAPHAHLLETGTARAGARPYFRPAFASNVDQVQALLVTAYGEGITVTPGAPGKPPKDVETG